MDLKSRLAERAKEREQAQAQKEGAWDEIVDLLRKGEVIPVISGAFRLEQIFRNLEPDAEAVDIEGNPLSVVETLVKYWADLIDYPMPDKYNLPQVFQYELVRKLKVSKEPDNDKARKIIEEITRKEIINFLKDTLLSMASDDPDYTDVVEGLTSHMKNGELTFAEMVRQLDYPRYAETKEDPIRLLARLPIKFYITTGQSDFLERALMAENKEPRTQICFWSKAQDTKPLREHRTDQNFDPTIKQPMVYHIFGLENYPETLVLSEDDHMKFLISVTEDINNQNPIIPLTLRKALVESQILFLGYRIKDWDFRVLFRLIMRNREGRKDATRGMIIQMDAKEEGAEKIEKARDYLKDYYKLNNFDIAWKDKNTGAFIQELWQEWNDARQRKP